MQKLLLALWEVMPLPLDFGFSFFTLGLKHSLVAQGSSTLSSPVVWIHLYEYSLLAPWVLVVLLALEFEQFCSSQCSSTCLSCGVLKTSIIVLFFIKFQIIYIGGSGYVHCNLPPTSGTILLEI